MESFFSSLKTERIDEQKMNIQVSLLSTSCTVPPRFKGKWVPPPALKDLGDRLEEHQFFLLTALPGSGKTRLMTRLHAELQTRMHICCWLRMMPQMQATGSIARNVATIFAQSVLGNNSATASLLMGIGIDSSTILTVALNEIAAFDGSVALFIDDVHTIDAEDAVQELQSVLDRAPANLQIMLASRAITGLKLSRLRNDGLLRDVVEADFAIAFKQVPEIVIDAGLPRPSLAELRELWHRTGGWVTGIRLLSRSKQRETSRDVAGSYNLLSKSLHDYFEEEMFAGLSDEARGALDLMLMPRRLMHDLMVNLIGDADAARYIAELEARGLLARQPTGDRPGYRAAPLLVEVTRAQSLLPQGDLHAIQRVCCDWFEANGHLTTAAAHAVDAGDVEHAIALIERCGIEMISHGDVTELQSWLPLLPLDKLRLRPIALLAVAWALSLLYRLDEADALLAPLENDLANSAELQVALAANLSALRVMHLSMRDDFGAASTAGLEWRRQNQTMDGWFGQVVDNVISFSLALAGDSDHGKLMLERAYLPDYYVNNPYAAIYSRCILGLIDLREGQIYRAEDNFAWAVKNAEADLNPSSTGAVMAAGLLAGACYERNDNERVHELMESYAWSLHSHLFTDARFHAYRAMARNLSRRGQYRAAISSLERIIDAGPTVRLPRVHADVLAEKVVIALDHQDTRTANAYSRALGEQLAALSHDDPLRPYVEAAMIGSQANLDIVLGAPESALPMLLQAIRMDVRGGWNLRAFHWAVLTVHAFWRLGKQRQAERLMERLLRYAAEAGIFQTILDGGANIKAVLDRLDQKPDSPRSSRVQAMLSQLRQAFDPSLAPVQQDNVASTAACQVLTEREIELIRFVRAGFTNRQIAERMKVSENTIKWHLKNVFEKASVKRRSELASLVLS